MLELVSNNLHTVGLVLAGLVAVLLGFFLYRKFSSKGAPSQRGTPLSELPQEPHDEQSDLPDLQQEPPQTTPPQDNSEPEGQTD